MTLELYKHQVESLDALKSGKKFMISIMGSGKGAVMLHWLKSTGKKKWLIVTTAAKRDEESIPKECDEWFGKEYRKSLSSFSVLSWAGLRGTKRIPNWFAEHRDELDEWAIAFDECLIGNTTVSTECSGVPICQLKVGDKVWSYNEQTGKRELKTVTRLIKKPMPNKMYCLRWRNGTIISTGNHPHYTQRGWVAAEDIKAGDILYEPKANRNRTQAQEVWQQFEMCVLSKRNTSRRLDRAANTASQSGTNILQQRVQSKISKQNLQPENEVTKSDEEIRMEIQSFTYQKRQRDRAYMDTTSRGEGWKWALQPSSDRVVASSMQDRQGVGDGTADQFGQTSARLSEVLQGGCRKHLLQDSNRMRWAEPQQQSSQEQGQEEGGEITGVRVETVEIYEPRDIKERIFFGDTDNVYCIDVEDNHNFFANGILTHNCHNAKAGISSSQGTQFLKITNSTDCWTAYTATPAEDLLGYYPYLTACGMVRNKSEYIRKYATVSVYRGFPEYHWHGEKDIIKQWEQVMYEPDVSELKASLPPETHRQIHFKKPTGYDKVDRTGYDLDGNFIETNSGLRHYLRRICFSKDKLNWVKEFVEGLQESCVIFYTYNVEGDELEAMLKKIKSAGKVWRISGKVHDIPQKDTIGKKDVVLAQWVSGSNSINLQFINYWISTTPHDSYRVSHQAQGRIQRIGATEPKFYYYLRCDGTEEDNIYANLKSKTDYGTLAWILKRKAEGKFLPQKDKLMGE